MQQENLKQFVTHLLFSFCLMFFWMSVHSQNRKVLECPIKFIKPVENINLDIEQNEKFYQFPWIVLSDRDNNITFKEPNSGIIDHKINFLSEFFVIDVKGDYLHIVEDKGFYEKEKLSDSAKDFGWINKNSLLLWRKCFYNQNGAAKKGYFTPFVNRAFFNNIDDEKNYVVKVYKDPELKSFDANCKLAYYNSIFIFKYYPNDKHPISILIASRDNLMRLDKDEIKIGWVDVDDIFEWDYRIGIGPNFDSEALEERKNKNISIYIFNDSLNARHYNISFDNYIVWNTNSMFDQKNVKLQHFPLLMARDGILKIAINSKKSGYTILKTINIEKPLWQFDILFTNNDLHELINLMNRISISYTDNELRETVYSYYQFVIKVLCPYLKTSETEVLRIEDIQLLLQNQPGLSDWFEKNLTLASHERRTDMNMYELAELIIRKKQILEEYYNSDLKSGNNSFFIEDRKYFWIPLKLL